MIINNSSWDVFWSHLNWFCCETYAVLQTNLWWNKTKCGVFFYHFLFQVQVLFLKLTSKIATVTLLAIHCEYKNILNMIADCMYFLWAGKKYYGIGKYYFLDKRRGNFKVNHFLKIFGVSKQIGQILKMDGLMKNEN